MPPEHLYELHGNINNKVCTKCNVKYAHDFVLRNQRLKKEITLDLCTQNGCDGKLNESFVNYGEKLNQLVVQGAFEVAGRAEGVCRCRKSHVTSVAY